MRRQAVLQIQDTDKLGLFHQWQAKKRPRLLAANVVVLGKRVLAASVTEDYRALRSDDLLEDRLRQFRARRRCSEKADLDAIPIAACVGLNPVFTAIREDQEAAVGPGM